MPLIHIIEARARGDYTVAAPLARALLRSGPPWAVLLLAVALVLGRLGGTAAAITAAFAAHACAICHGCPVADHHAVCDCTACEDVAAGRACHAPSIHDPMHAGGAAGAQDAPPAALGPAACPLLLAARRARVLPRDAARAPISRGPPAPSPPPPRA